MPVTINLGRVKGSIWYVGAADSDAAIMSEVVSAGNKPILLDMYLNAINGNVYQYLKAGDSLQWLLKGNLRGAKGEGFQIKKTYDSVEAMNAGYATDGVPLYGFVLIDTGDVNDEDNAKLYVKGDAAYQYLIDLSGAQGIKGETGNTGAAAGFGLPEATIDGLTGVPTVEIETSGDNTAKIFKFHFSGLKGETGQDGKTPALSLVNGELVATFE